MNFVQKFLLSVVLIGSMVRCSVAAENAAPAGQNIVIKGLGQAWYGVQQFHNGSTWVYRTGIQYMTLMSWCYALWNMMKNQEQNKQSATVQPQQTVMPKVAKLTVPDSTVQPKPVAMPKAAKQIVLENSSTEPVAAQSNNISPNNMSKQNLTKQAKEIDVQTTMTKAIEMQTDAPSFTARMKELNSKVSKHKGRGYAGRRRRYQHARNVRNTRSWRTA